jgi:DNA gyrase/topoisomerase IV subunit A
MSYEDKIIKIIEKMDEDKDFRKEINQQYNLIKGQEHYLLYVLVKAFGESIDQIKRDASNQIKTLTKDVKSIVADISKKLSNVEHSWMEIATSLGKLSEYGAIIGEFSGKLDVLIQDSKGKSKK